MRAPQRVRQAGLPARVTIHEVGPRDGLQNESAIVPVEVKAEFIERLADAGMRTIEATSFVRPEWVPQLADAEQLLAAIERHDGVRYPVLVPNARGLERALTLGVRDIAIFGSATETFARRNLNRSVAESIAMFAPVVERARDNGCDVRAYVSMCFGDPWEGDVPIGQVVDAGARLLDLGCTQLSLGDTIGVATPGHVTALLAGFADDGIGADRLAVHFHDTYGQALANLHAVLPLGVAVIDASVSGLGGCPYAPGAAGNVATEDVVYMLHGMGIETGIDLDKLADTGAFISEALGRASGSKAAMALRAKAAKQPQ
jgi:hydroxymethylglutaryl-CoA lyase